MKISRQFFTIFLLFSTGFCAANNHSSGLDDQISRFLKSYATQLTAKGYRSEYSFGKIGPGLSIRNCDQHLNLSFNRKPIKQSHVTILAECLDAKPWKLFINVAFKIYGPTMVASKTILRGTRITASMLATKEEIINQGRYNTYSSSDNIIGMQTKKSIQGGTAIRPSHLKAPNLVKRGDKVIIIVANSAVSVKMNGTALSNGVQGEQIPIRNNQSKRVIKAKVIGSGRVLVSL